MSSGKLLVNGNDFYVGNGSNEKVQLARLDQVPAAYTHPTSKQCNYSYTHPTGKQCSWTPDLSNYATKSDLQSASKTSWETIGIMSFNSTVGSGNYTSNTIQVDSNRFNVIRIYVQSYSFGQAQNHPLTHTYLGCYINGGESLCVLKTGECIVGSVPSVVFSSSKSTNNAYTFTNISRIILTDKYMYSSFGNLGPGISTNGGIHFRLYASDEPGIYENHYGGNAFLNIQVNINVIVEGTTFLL